MSRRFDASVLSTGSGWLNKLAMGNKCGKMTTVYLSPAPSFFIGASPILPKQNKIYPQDDLKILSTLNLLDNHQYRLGKLEDTLNRFDAEMIYSIMESDFIAKDRLVQEYLDTIENIRTELADEGVDTDQRAFLDGFHKIVDTFRKDFKAVIEKKFRLLDEIFVIKTRDVRYDLDDLEKRVGAYVSMPDAICEEEHEKMCKVHDLLENEEITLKLALTKLSSSC